MNAKTWRTTKNAERAERARKAVSVHNRALFNGNAAASRQEMRHALETCIVDLLCDVRHLCDVSGLDFGDIAESSANHHHGERTGDDFDPTPEEIEEAPCDDQCRNIGCRAAHAARGEAQA